MFYTASNCKTSVAKHPGSEVHGSRSQTKISWLIVTNSYFHVIRRQIITYDEFKIPVSDRVFNLKLKKETTDHTHMLTTLKDAALSHTPLI